MQKCLFLIAAVVLAGCSTFDPDLKVSVDDLRIEIFGASRGMEYSNADDGLYVTETNAEHLEARHGWHVGSQKILDDYLLTVDNRELLKSQVHLTQVYPHQFQRAYPVGVQETVTFLDSVDAIVIELSIVKGSTVGLRPLFSERAHSDPAIIRHGNSAIFSRGNDAGVNQPPVWLGVTVVGAEPEVVQSAVDNGTLTSPVMVRASVVKGSAVAILTAGTSREQLLGRIRFVTENYKELIQRRKGRLQALLDRMAFRASDQRLEKAVHWASISMDGLMARQGSRISEEVFTLDVLQAMPGGWLVNGNFPAAREVLWFLARRQNGDPASPNYGRIPDRIAPASISFTSAEVTPRFIETLGEYVNYSGDTAFARAMFPVVKRAIDGTLKHHVDRYVLLRHGDAETWMNTPGTPRGDRANDIQALWYRQLLISTWLAGIADDEKSFREWFSFAEQVRISFNRSFVDPSTRRMYDHLNSDGTPDLQMRPNQILTLELIDDHVTRFSVFQRATEALVYRHGVGTLAQNEPGFSPFADQNRSPHNGLVWARLAGPWISATTKFGYTDTAYKITETMIRQILDRGAIGTLPDCFEVSLHSGEDEPRDVGIASGMTGLAEFLRNVHQDYLGVAVDAVEKKLELAPHLPSSVSDAAFNVTIGPNVFRVRYHRSPSEGLIHLSSPAGAPTIDVVATWRLESGIEHNFAYFLNPLTEAEIRIQMDGVYVEDGNGSRKLQMNIIRGFDPDSSLAPISLAIPGSAAQHADAPTP